MGEAGDANVRKKLGVGALTTLVKLYQDRPWLSDLHDRVMDLMSMCEDLEEQLLISSLLRRFKLVTGSELNGCFARIAAKVVEEWHLPEESTQIAATTWDNSADSGQFIAWGLKEPFAERGWQSVPMTNTCGGAVKYMPGRPNIVLVDEFVGTGRSLVGRIEWLKKALASEGQRKTWCEVPTFRVCVIACIEDAVAAVEATGAVFHAEFRLRKGISGYLADEDRALAVERMLRLESALSAQDEDGEPLPSLGHGGAEALYKLEMGHVPNSVFPVFWWPRWANGEVRHAMFARRMKD
jgi:hypothetical protein